VTENDNTKTKLEKKETKRNKSFFVLMNSTSFATSQNAVPKDSIEEVEATVQRRLKVGIRHNSRTFRQRHRRMYSDG
jgi:hypothetical protein